MVPSVSFWSNVLPFQLLNKKWNMNFRQDGLDSCRLRAIAVCTETNVDAQISPAHYTNPHGTAGCALLHTAFTLVTKVMPQLTNIYLLCWWLRLVCSCRVYHIGWTWNAEVQQTCCSNHVFLEAAKWGVLCDSSCSQVATFNGTTSKTSHLTMSEWLTTRSCISKHAG